MPPRLPLRFARKQLARPCLRTQPTLSLCIRRSFADEKSFAERPLGNDARQNTDANGQDMDQMPHVSEEAAAMSKVKGEQGPEIEEHGTPVEEVAEGDKDLEKHLPKVMKDEMKKDNPSGSRNYSTFARSHIQGHAKQSRQFSTSHARHLNAQQEYELSERPSWRPAPIEETAVNEELNEDEYEDEDGVTVAGHKFGLPSGPYSQRNHLRKRYEPLVDQITKLIMKDGKLAVAQRNMSTILSHLATSPAPRLSPARPLLLAPDNPPSSLPMNPTLYLTAAIDSVAPVFRIRSQKGAGGGGVALQIPIPLQVRQRRRTAIMWILDQVNKKKGGTSMFPKRFAEEVIAVVEGTSPVWERRTALHALGVRSRTNITVKRR